MSLIACSTGAGEPSGRRQARIMPATASLRVQPRTPVERAAEHHRQPFTPRRWPGCSAEGHESSIPAKRYALVQHEALEPTNVRLRSGTRRSTRYTWWSGVCPGSPITLNATPGAKPISSMSRTARWGVSSLDAAGATNVTSLAASEGGCPSPSRRGSACRLSSAARALISALARVSDLWASNSTSSPPPTRATGPGWSRSVAPSSPNASPPGDVVVVDVRPAAEHSAGHSPGRRRRCDCADVPRYGAAMFDVSDIRRVDGALVLVAYRGDW